MKSFVGLMLFFFSVGCFALPECKGSPAKGEGLCGVFMVVMMLDSYIK